MKVIIAIDPGAEGGIAVRVFGQTVCHAMPDTEGDRLELIRDIKRAAEVEHAECVCVLEEVGGFAGQAQPGSAMFKFGQGFGFLRGVVQTLGIKLELVRPQTWQKVFGLGTAASCAKKNDWKNKLKAEAQRRFPDLKVTLKTADALLILEWALLADGRQASAQGQINFSHPGVGGAHGVTRPTGNRNGGRSATRPTKRIFRRDAEKDSRDGGSATGQRATNKPKTESENV